MSATENGTSSRGLQTPLQNQRSIASFDRWDRREGKFFHLCDCPSIMPEMFSDDQRSRVEVAYMRNKDALVDFHSEYTSTLPWKHNGFKLPFFTHAILLDQAFTHYPRFLTAALHGSLGHVSVPVWLIYLERPAKHHWLGEPLPNQRPNTT
ncbi:ATP synthase subunit alpha [Cucumis melo var. makuwa]|uniref:ATP synthase subunit alpha n=1 Tax=Cucumis melo var. makuwa TaxID=1194695 RepID=A0A5A7VQ56_CUCMM|nr:ATP synthase subunit alpha [Cucumis melo var. makuwa]